MASTVQWCVATTICDGIILYFCRTPTDLNDCPFQGLCDFTRTAPGCIRLNLAIHGCTWMYMGVPGCTWMCLTVPDCNWLYFTPSWLYLAVPGCSWQYLPLSILGHHRIVLNMQTYVGLDGMGLDGPMSAKSTTLHCSANDICS